MSKLRPHIVRAGDTPLRLSVMYDVPIETIRDHEKNEALVAYFKNDLLPVGETVTIPVEPRVLTISGQTTNKFVATVPMHRVRIHFEDGKGPLANEPYEIRGLRLPRGGGDLEDDAVLTGNLDGTGLLDQLVPLHVEQIVLVFPQRWVEHTIWVGHLAPPDQDLGCEARLLHLGFGPTGQLEGDPFTFNDRAAREAAITSMQVAHGLGPNGYADNATLDNLTAAHGEVGLASALRTK